MNKNKNKMDAQLVSKNFPVQRSFTRHLFKQIINVNKWSPLYGEIQFIKANQKLPDKDWKGTDSSFGQATLSLTRVRSLKRVKAY